MIFHGVGYGYFLEPHNANTAGHSWLGNEIKHSFYLIKEGDRSKTYSWEPNYRKAILTRAGESCRPVNPILHWLLLLDRPRPQQWYITYTELITLSNTLYNAEISIFANKYKTYGPQNRATTEEQHYTNAGNSLLAKLSQYLLKILHFSLHKKHNSCWARKDLRCKHTIGQNIKSQ